MQGKLYLHIFIQLQSSLPNSHPPTHCHFYTPNKIRLLFGAHIGCSISHTCRYFILLWLYSQFWWVYAIHLPSKMNVFVRAQLIFQRLTLLQNIYTTRASILEHGTANVWPWWLKWSEHLAWIRRLGVRDPLRSVETSSAFRNLRHFHKTIRLWVENEFYCPRTVNISNVNVLTNTFFWVAWSWRMWEKYVGENIDNKTSQNANAYIVGYTIVDSTALIVKLRNVH